MLGLPSPARATSPEEPAAWTDELEVRRCDRAPLQLPAETEAALDATLLVRTAAGVGSAVLISPDGFALTAAHVVGHAESVQVVVRSGDTVDAVVIRVDEARDTALVHVASDSSLPCLVPAESPPGLGTEVFVLGSPAGEELSFSVAKGIVGGHRMLFGGQRFLQLDASVNPGNSGGPVVGPTGNVLGIASWKISHVTMEGLAFAVPISDALASLEVVLADQTGDGWAARKGRKRSTRTSSPAAPPASYVNSAEREARHRQWRGHRMMILGGVVAGVGLGTVLGTGIPLFGDNEHGVKTRRALIGSHAAGWGVIALGAAAIVVGAILKYRPKKALGRTATLWRGHF